MKHGEATSTWHAKWQGWGKENSHQCWGEEQFWGQFLPSLIPEAKQIDGQECKAGSLLKNTMKSLMFTKCCPGPRRKKKTLKKGPENSAASLKLSCSRCAVSCQCCGQTMSLPHPSEKSPEERISWIWEYP